MRRALIVGLALAALVLVGRVARADEAPVDPSTLTVDPSTFKVCLVPMGPYEKRLVPIISRGITWLYGMPVDVLAHQTLPDDAYYPRRRRWRAEKLIAWLDEHVLPSSGCQVLIGLTSADVSTTKGDVEDWGVLGLADIGGTSAVISSKRAHHRARRRLVARRMVNVANHELGHLLGADHSDEAGCIMDDAGGTVSEIDAESGLLCTDSITAIETARHLALPAHDRFDWDAVLDGK